MIAVVCEQFALATDQSGHRQRKRPDVLQMVRTRRDSVAACIAVANDFASNACLAHQLGTKGQRL